MGQYCQSFGGRLGKTTGRNCHFCMVHWHSNQHQYQLKLVLTPQCFISFTDEEAFCKWGRGDKALSTGQMITKGKHW